jgi:nicotinamidase-related amidase
MLVDGTDPYPWPYHGDLRGERLALVVVGPQERWVANSVDTDAVLGALSAVARSVRSVGGRVVVVRHGVTDRPLRSGRSVRRPEHLDLPARHTTAWELVVPVDPETLVVDAGGFDGFHGSTLDDELRDDGRDTLILGGCASEVLVDCTLRSANDRGYECLVLSDGCAPLDHATGDRALASVTMSGGIFGAVGTTDQLNAALAAPRSRRLAS